MGGLADWTGGGIVVTLPLLGRCSAGRDAHEWKRRRDASSIRTFGSRRAGLCNSGRCPFEIVREG